MKKKTDIDRLMEYVAAQEAFSASLANVFIALQARLQTLGASALITAREADALNKAIRLNTTKAKVRGVIPPHRKRKTK